MNTLSDLDRLIFLLETVRREGEHLVATTQRLLAQPIDTAWVETLETDFDRGERVDAFVARFGRTQDTIGDRLIPELRRALLETPESTLDNLNRMEKLGLVEAVAGWIEARNLRNRLVHEYMRDPSEFAAALNRAGALVSLLINAYNVMRDYAEDRFPTVSIPPRIWQVLP